MVNKDVIAHIRGNVVESAANTYTEETINTNINPMSNQIMMIHDITFEVLAFNELVAAADQINVCLLKQTKTTTPRLHDPDVIDKLRLGISLVGAAGYDQENLVYTRHFDPPEPIAVDELILSIEGVSLTNPHEASVDIRYTPAKVSDGEFAKMAKF